MLPVQEAVMVDGGRTLTRPACSEFEVRTALRRLQRRFHLKPSGRLDEDTVKLMGRGRCGNTDSDILKQPKTLFHRSRSRGRYRRSVVDVSLEQTPNIVFNHAGSRVRRKRSTDEENGSGRETELLQNRGSSVRQSVNASSQQRPDLQTVLRLGGMRLAESVPIGRRPAEMTSSLGSRLSAGSIDHDDLHSRLRPGTDHEPGAALARRRKMFIEIRKRHRLQIAAEALQGGPARSNHTEEELAAIRQRIRSGRAQRPGRVYRDEKTYFVRCFFNCL